MFERREQIVQVGRAGLRPGEPVDVEREPAFAGARQGGLPFTLAAVENQHGVAGPEPQHIAQVICLRRIERDACPFRKRRIEKKAGGAEIVASHGSKIGSKIGLKIGNQWPRRRISKAPRFNEQKAGGG